MSYHSREKDLTRGNIWSQLWTLAWPMMLSMFFYTLYNIVDAFWVSKLSVDAIAAVSISQITLFMMIALGMGISAGSSVVMGMHIGAKQKDKAEKVLGQSFVLATGIGVVFTLFAILFREELLHISGAVGTIYAPALDYFTVTSAGALLSFYLMNIMFAFNSEGDTLTLTKLFALSTLINSVLDPLLIFGYGGFPQLGIQGAAYATLISQMAFVVLGVFILSRPYRSVRFSFENLGFSWESVRKVFRIGFPASLTQMINPVGTTLLISLVSLSFFEAGATAYSLIFRLEFFAYLPAIGFGMAAMALIGQSMGAGDILRSRDVFRKVMLFAFGSATGFGLLLMIFGRFVLHIFTEDPDVIEYAFSYFLIVAGTYGMMAMSMVVSSVFQALGRSWPGFWLVFVKFFVIALPFSYLVSEVYHFSLWSIWCVIALSNAIIALIGYVSVRKTFQNLLAETPNKS